MDKTPYEKKRTELMNRQYEERQNVLSDHKLRNEAFGKKGPPKHISQEQKNDINKLNLKHNKEMKEFRAQNQSKTGKELSKDSPSAEKQKVPSKEKQVVKNKEKGQRFKENKQNIKKPNKGKGGGKDK